MSSFAAFYDASRGRFLVEDITLRVSPSAGAFAAAATASARGTIAEPLVFNGAGCARTPRPLRRPIAPASVLLRPRGDPRQFFADAADRRVVHVAARDVSQRQLTRSCRASSSPTNRAGVIRARSWAATSRSARCRNTGLVVIDEAGSGASNRGEGTSSLARAFMAAGVPAVVGTLPGADESAARDLMIGFHRELAKGVSAEQALSRVQRNAIEQNGRRLGAWSALVLYGSDR